MAEWSKVLASGASPQGRGFEPHSCHALPLQDSHCRPHFPKQSKHFLRRHALRAPSAKQAGAPENPAAAGAVRARPLLHGAPPERFVLDLGLRGASSLRAPSACLACACLACAVRSRVRMLVSLARLAPASGPQCIAPDFSGSSKGLRTAAEPHEAHGKRAQRRWGGVGAGHRVGKHWGELKLRAFSS